MEVVEIILGFADRSTVRIAPEPGVVTLVPIAGADLVSSAVRETLSKPGRESRPAIPFVRVTLRDGDREMSVADDAAQGLRMLSESVKKKPRFALEARTAPILADPHLEVLLARIATTLGAELPDDLGPALADTGERTPDAKASPKELAYKRAHARAASLAREVRDIDTKMTGSVVPDWLFVATGFGAVGVLMTVVVLYNPDLRVYVVPTIMIALFIGLAIYAYRGWSELKTRDTLGEVRIRVREEREVAREEERELAQVLRKKGVDPDEVLERFGAAGHPPGLPTLISRKTTSKEEVTSFGLLGRQVIVFVEKDAVSAGEDLDLSPPEVMASPL